jgi:hypothetical protein
VLPLLGLAIGLVLLTGLLGPSAAQPPLPGASAGLPPYWLTARPSPYLVTGLLLAAGGSGALGLALGLRALGHGWLPPRAASLGAVLAPAAMALVPPMGSADHLVYAAYGRLAVLGLSPYTHTAHQLAARGDPVGRAVEAPWTATPSVYGPVGTAEQWLAARIGGDSPHQIVLALTVLGAVAFILTSLILRRVAGPDPVARARVLLLFSLNPLLLFEVVGGAHIDALALVLAVAALAVVRRSAWSAGALVGAACAVKLSFGLYVLALGWSLRARPRRLGALLGGALLVGIGTYQLAGVHALDQARANSRLVSFATVPRLLFGPLEHALGEQPARTVVAALGAAGLVAVAVALTRVVPGVDQRAMTPTSPAEPRLTGPIGLGSIERDVAVRAALVLTLAWSLTAPYSLPWYDVAAWAPLAVSAASPADWLLLVRTMVMTWAYLPGLVVTLPATLDTLTGTLRGVLAPTVGVVLLIVVVWCSVRARRPASARLRSQPP